MLWLTLRQHALLRHVAGSGRSKEAMHELAESRNKPRVMVTRSLASVQIPEIAAAPEIMPGDVN